MSTLTKILINPQRRQGRKLLANPQAMHAAVAASFPPDVDQESGRILWRLDEGAHHHSLYVVGPEKPTDHVIVEQAGWDTRPGQSVEYDRLLNSLTKGQRWIFELVANPTYSQANGGKRGKVKAHVSVEHQLEWLYRRAENAGFELAPEQGMMSAMMSVLGGPWKKKPRLLSEKRWISGKEMAIGVCVSPQPDTAEPWRSKILRLFGTPLLMG